MPDAPRTPLLRGGRLPRAGPWGAMGLIVCRHAQPTQHIPKDNSWYTSVISVSQPPNDINVVPCLVSPPSVKEATLKKNLFV